MNKVKNYKIGNMRAFAIFLVILGHSSILYTGWAVMETTRIIPNISVLKNFINILEMPIFMAISGYLFYYTITK